MSKQTEIMLPIFTTLIGVSIYLSPGQASDNKLLNECSEGLYLHFLLFMRYDR